MGSSGSSVDNDLVLPQQQVVGAGGTAARRDVPSAPVTQHAAISGAVKSQVSWEKASFRVNRTEGSKTVWELTGDFSAEVPCELVCTFNCRESLQGQILAYDSVDSAAPGVFRIAYSKGKNKFCLNGDHAINLRSHPLDVFWKFKASQRDVIPIALSLQAPGFQAVAHLALDRSPNAQDLQSVFLRQMVVVSGQPYTVQEMYGLAELGADTSKHDESNVGEPCVICLTEPRNTAVFPCRHVCVCEECGGHLKAGAVMRSEKCPICRGPITDLKVFDIKQPSGG